MRGALGGPRVLLRRLREVMAEPVSAQERLDKIVVLIAANMVAEVCSVYVLRVDGTLELYATEGLKREAVHQTVLQPDEGLVGLVASEAKPVNLAHAQSHPAFSFRPETGEEIYHAFLGVPVLRAGNTLGVLTVQNRARRTYTEEEEEALQTTAMVLAEMIASGELSSIARPGAGPAVRHSLQLEGATLSDGIALGHVVLHEPRVVITNVIADDVPKELKRLDAAIATLRADLDRMLEHGDVADGGEHRDVLEAYRMFGYDQGWLHKIREAVMTGLSAEAAVERVQSDTRARMLRLTDPYLRDRMHDLEDLADRLMRIVMGRDHAPSREQLPENAILVARSMGPAALLDYDRKRLRGLVLEEGGPTSHVSIVARALGIPAVGEVENASGLVETGDAIIVDGTSGHVHLRQPADIESAYAERAKLRARRQAQYHALRDRPCVTKDGHEIALMINAGLMIDPLQGEVKNGSLYLLLALAFPAVLINLGHGHNGFLTAALITSALMQLQKNPTLAGVLFGLMAYKPQFGVLVPLVLLAGGYWRAFFAAAATVATLTVIVTAAFGLDVWHAFFDSLAFTREVVLERGDTGWHKIQSVFSWVRMWGGGVTLAYVLQASSALPSRSP